MNLNSLTKELFEHLMIEIKKDKYKDNIRTYILDPSVCYILDKFIPI